jgi:RsiW-degrading membrane proteinase PrsW (M82 family)
MVFQSTIPIAFGLALTEWDLDKFALVSAGLGVAGGILAYWALRLRGRFEPLAIALWSALFAAFIVYVAVA